MLRWIVWAMALCMCAAGAARAQDAKAKGEQIFTDQKCSLCHSIAGKGNAKGSLDDVGTKGLRGRHPPVARRHEEHDRRKRRRRGSPR